MTRKKTTKTPTVRLDGWANVFSGLGTERDRRDGAFVLDKRFTPEQLETAYRNSDMLARIVDEPPAEMLRAGWTLGIEGDTTDAAGWLHARADELDIDSKLQETLSWARLFGGAALVLGVDDGRDASDPVDEENVRGIEFANVLTGPELHPASWYGDPSQPKYGEVEVYQIQQRASIPGKSPVRAHVHASRLVAFDGVRVTPRQRVINHGWGDSVVQRTWEVLRDFESAWGGAGHLLTDFAQGVFAIKGLSEALAAGQENLVKGRLEALEMSRSIVRAIAIDAEGESFERKATPVTGLDVLLEKFSLRLAAAADMPVSRLMGQSPGGLANSDDGQTRWWYDRIAAKQNKELRPRLNYLIKLLLLSHDSPTRGIEPDAWTVSFSPLWQLSELQQAELRNKQAQTDQIYWQIGSLDPAEIRNSRFGGDVYSIETQLDASLDEPEAAPTEETPSSSADRSG